MNAGPSAQQWTCAEPFSVIAKRTSLSSGKAALTCPSWPSRTKTAEIGLRGLSTARVGLKLTRSAANDGLDEVNTARVEATTHARRWVDSVCDSVGSHPISNGASCIIRGAGRRSLDTIDLAASTVCFAGKAGASVSLGVMEISAGQLHSLLGVVASLFGVPVSEISGRDEAKACEMFLELLMKTPELKHASLGSVANTLLSWGRLQRASGTLLPYSAPKLLEAMVKIGDDAALRNLFDDDLPELLTLCICAGGSLAASALLGDDVPLKAGPIELIQEFVPWGLKATDFLAVSCDEKQSHPAYAILLDRGHRVNRPQCGCRLVVVVHVSGIGLAEPLTDMLQFDGGGWVWSKWFQQPSFQPNALFQQAANFLDEELREFVRDEFARIESHFANPSLLICGHGSAGAIAALLAMRWQHDGMFKAESGGCKLRALAFNAPCVLPALDARACEDNITSILFGCDSLSRASPWSMKRLVRTIAYLAPAMTKLHEQQQSNIDGAHRDTMASRSMFMTHVQAMASATALGIDEINTCDNNIEGNLMSSTVATARSVESLIHASEAARHLASEIRLQVERGLADDDVGVFLVPPGKTFLLVPPEILNSGELQSLQRHYPLEHRTRGGAVVVAMKGLELDLGEILVSIPDMFTHSLPHETLRSLSSISHSRMSSSISTDAFPGIADPIRHQESEDFRASKLRAQVNLPHEIADFI